MTTETNQEDIFYNIYFPDGEKFISPYTIERIIKMKIAENRFINPKQIKFFIEGEEEEIKNINSTHIKEGIITLFCLIQPIIKFSDVESFTFEDFKNDEGEENDEAILNNLTISGFSVIDDKIKFTLYAENNNSSTELEIKSDIMIIEDENSVFERVFIMTAEQREDDNTLYNVCEFIINANNTCELINYYTGFEGDEILEMVDIII